MTNRRYRDMSTNSNSKALEVTVRSLSTGEVLRVEPPKDPRQVALDEHRELMGMGEELVDRNAAIVAMYQEEQNITKIARVFGIHKVRVKQILDKEASGRPRSPAAR